MKTSRIAPTLALAGAALTMWACTSDEYSILLRGISLPDKSDCAYNVASDNDVFLSQGVLDLSFPAGRYVVGVQVNNYIEISTPNTEMMTSSALPGLALNASDIIPRYAHARMRAPKEDGTGATFGDYQWTVELTGMVIPAGESPLSPGRGVVVFELVPNSVFAAQISGDKFVPIAVGDPDARAIIDFYIQFDTGSGSTVYSSTMSFMLKICYGCLNGFTNLDPSTCVFPDCTVTGACFPGQDAWSYGVTKTAG